MITQKKLKESLKYNKVTGVFKWKRPTRRHQNYVGCVAGGLSNGYVEICINKVSVKAHRLAWLYEYGYIPENQIDHINRDKTDNRISNLREVSQSCNNRNTGNHKSNTSGVKGVYFNKNAKKWSAIIGVAGRNIFIGYFNEFINAVCARLAVEQCLNWSGCDSSSPALKYVVEYLNE